MRGYDLVVEVVFVVRALEWGERQITSGTIVFRCETIVLRCERERESEKPIDQTARGRDWGNVRRRLFGDVQTGNGKSEIIMT